ncbi:MAG: hypothetical protein HQQ73_10135, partial [Desulfobulbaceae bacterium]|nr:hypothetical protein [Desulfobulbaceae bacterium]
MKKPYDAGWKIRIISISAEKIFFVLCHALPIDPSSLSRFRKRIGEKGCELILQVTVQAGLISGAVKANSLERVSIDTTVQEKAVAYPTDARLFNHSRERLVQFAGKHGVRLRQNYNRLAWLQAAS